MQSLKEFYLIGPGPSSSHTIGPYRASQEFLKEAENVAFNRVEVTLFGSLTFTGKGHKTDDIILKVFKDYPTNIIFDYQTKTKHPNTFKINAFLDELLVLSKTYVSTGGGSFNELGRETPIDKRIYPFKSFEEIKTYMNEENIETLDQFVDKFEPDLNSYLEKVLEVMFNSVELGISTDGFLYASKTLQVKRVAKDMYLEALSLDDLEKQHLLLASFAYAVAEVNAAQGLIVTAPTCGSSGILPSILYYAHKYQNVPKEKLINALKVAGIIGNLFKHNASISGAVHGCQAEIGVATTMGAVALASINNLSLYALEYAAEVALEHALGLTCDPVDGYVVIPCIERNGVFVIRAVSSYLLAKNVSKLRKNRVSLDNIIETMKITGDAIHPYYRETSKGGLAKIIKDWYLFYAFRKEKCS